MQKIKISILKLTLAGILLVSMVPGYSQLTNTLYFMKGVPQIYQANPAFQPGFKFFIGLPGLAPLQVRVQNEPLVLKDVLVYNETEGKLVYFMHDMASKEAFFRAMNTRNYLNADIGVPLVSIGFGSPTNGTFAAFDITQRVANSVNYPKDFLKLLINGPDQDATFDFDGFGINTMVYTEVAMNLSKRINDFITVGWRGKVLLGQTDISTSKFDVTLASSQESWKVHSNIVLDATLPFLDVQYDSDGMISPDSTRMIENPEKQIQQLAFNPKNKGLAMDLGVDIVPFDKLHLSASLVDFGSINWKDKVYNLSNNSNYEFNGVEVTLDGVSPMDKLQDSLKNSFKFRATENSYRTWLPTKLYLGAEYYVHPKISFGLLSRTEFYKKDIRQQFTVSANLYPARMLSTSFSYSVIEGTYKNLGLGLALKAFPFNFYLITDTAPSLALWPEDAKYLNLRLGMNLTFGGKQKKTVKYDMPLVD
jgi:hypothetical protein